MPERWLCVSCDKDNHRFCLGGDCECGVCVDPRQREENVLREGQTYGRGDS